MKWFLLPVLLLFLMPVLSATELLGNSNKQNKPYIYKHPTVRKQIKSDINPTLAQSVISPYLIERQVVAETWLEQQPAVLGGNTARKYYVKDDLIYVQRELNLGRKVGIYAPARVLVDPESSQLLGQEIILSGSGVVIESGDISKIKLLKSYRETQIGYRILTQEEPSILPASFTQKPATINNAVVLASGAGRNVMGKLDVLYLNKGRLDGVAVGDVFMVYPSQNTLLPVSSNAKVMVFNTSDNISFGLIIDSEIPVRVGDKLLPPVTK